MAKSLRSKGKRKARAVKRVAVFEPVEKKRLEMLAQKQAEAANQAPLELYPTPDGNEMAMDEERGRGAGASMEMDEKPMSRIEKEKLLLSRNQFKKKMKARAKSKKRGGRVSKK